MTPWSPLNLLVWGVSVTACTLACALEQQSAPHLTHEEKMALAKLYFPYLIPCNELRTSGEGEDLF